jgi:hypothetical protein
MGPKPKKRTVGDVVQVPLGEGWHSYARVLPEVSVAFYDSRERELRTPNEVVKRPILFIVAVMNSAFKKGRWPIVGHIPLEVQLKDPPTFIQDQLNKDSFQLYEAGVISPATREQCVGLERCAVWDPEHVEDRLRDHYAGRKNKWVESLKMKN